MMKFLCLFLIIIGLAFLPIKASENSPQFIVHLLDYLAGDYAGAVQNGKIIAKSEYAEQLEFVETVFKLSTTLPEVKSHPEITAKVNSLKKLIENKSDAKKVSKTARDIQKDIILTLKIVVAPNSMPDFKRGQKLFAANCIQCHGANGFGDGVDGKNLDPKPANFHNLERMKEISMFHAYNTIRMGVPGTGMSAWHELSDKEVWDLATFVMGVRYLNNKAENISSQSAFKFNELTTLNDEDIKNKITGTKEEKEKALIFYRTTFNSGDSDNNNISKTKKILDEAKEIYEKGNLKDAEKLAINAYLEGIEPIEPALKANQPDLLPKIETAMADLRKEFNKENNLSTIEQNIQSIHSILGEIETAIKKEEMSFGLAASGSFAIILREGFEAVLIIITLLSLLSLSNNKKAILYVHGGWILAILVGAITWLLSGVLINISGLGQEMIEAVTSVLAVLILLYFGFWLHRQTEVHRWKKFIEDKVKNAIDNSNLLALGSISFMATYREAFETVLFVRTIWTQSGASGKNGILLGLIAAFVIIFIFAYWAVKFSAKIPVKQLFRVSAWMMCGLAFILAGKAVHAFQTVGIFSISELPIHFNFDLLGLHSTTQTITTQIIVLTLSFYLLKNPNQNKIG